MRNSCVLLFLMLLVGLQARGLALAAEKVEFAIAIHGGAGVAPESLSNEDREAFRASLAKALEVGRAILARDGAALDAVEATIRVLEDDPLFNAGRGAVFNSIGKHELDASLMDGKSGGAGAVAGVTTVKNPISLARLVMSETRHVLLVGDGAENFADEMKERVSIARVPNEYFSTERSRQEWLQEVEKQKRSAEQAAPPKSHKGTVGCVALDKHGHLAAGTSTGGLTNKKLGRVGDSPIIGAGTYANDATCAVSCTGIGELFIKQSAAFHVSALMAYKGLTLDEAVRNIIDNLLPRDSGGMIAVDRLGQVTMQMNTPGMARAMADSTGKVEVKLGR